MRRKIYYNISNCFACEDGVFELPPYEDISEQTIDNFIYGMAEDLATITADGCEDEADESTVFDTLHYEWQYID